MFSIYSQKWVLWLVPGKHEQEGICLWPFIFYSCNKKNLNVTLKLHEEFHWKHQLKWWLIPWVIIYWMLILFYGYKNHPWEILAREAENERN